MKKIIFISLLTLVAANIFSQTQPDELWKSRALYIGASGGLGPITGPDGTVLGGGLGPLRVDWQITNYLALGTGLGFYFGPKTMFTAPKQTDPSSGIFETYGGMEAHIIFPLLVKYTLKPKIFSIELGAGAYVATVAINTTVERTNENGYTVSEAYGKKLFTSDRKNPFGFTASGTFGVKVWQGIMFLDVSYFRDFSETTVFFNDQKAGRNLWNILAFQIGYKYGFFKMGRR